MPKIVLINVGTDHAIGDEADPTHPVTRSGWRHAWFADEGDVIVSPVAIERGFLRYIADTLGFDADAVSVLTRDRILTDEVLLASDFIKELERSLGPSGPWQLMPCFWTEGVAELSARLGLADDVGLRFGAQRGSSLLNRKSHFRQLAAGIDLPLPEGSVVNTPRRLAEAIERHLPATGTVIVKRDDGAGGMGNITLTTGAVAALPGSFETRQARGDMSALAREVWDTLTNWSSQTLVVESYHAAMHRVYFEYRIGRSGWPELLDSGTIRARPDTDPRATELVWVGLDIPAELPPLSLANASGLAMRLAGLAADIGYRGHINVDAIVADTGALLFNEVNARWGGGLVMHSIAERLLGERYADHHVASSVRDLRPALLEEVLSIVRDQGLHFSRESKEGVLVLACDPALRNGTECLLLGPSLSRVRDIEASLREALMG